MLVTGKFKFKDYYLFVCLLEADELKNIPPNKIVIRHGKTGIIKTNEDLEKGAEYNLDEIVEKLEEFSDSERLFLSFGRSKE